MERDSLKVISSRPIPRNANLNTLQNTCCHLFIWNGNLIYLKLNSLETKIHSELDFKSPEFHLQTNTFLYSLTFA